MVDGEPTAVRWRVCFKTKHKEWKLFYTCGDFSHGWEQAPVSWWIPPLEVHVLSGCVAVGNAAPWRQFPSFHWLLGTFTVESHFR